MSGSAGREPVTVLELERGRTEIARDEAVARSGRGSRTLLKSGPLRVTLIALAPGGEIAEHQADGPITVQPLSGRIRFTALGRAHDVGPGQLLAVEAGVRHAVASVDGAVFLLTLALRSGPPS